MIEVPQLDRGWRDNNGLAALNTHCHSDASAAYDGRVVSPALVSPATLVSTPTPIAAHLLKPILGEFCNGPASERAEGVVANILARLTREITEHCRERLTGTKAAREANSYRLFSAPFVATSKGLL